MCNCSFPKPTAGVYIPGLAFGTSCMRAALSRKLTIGSIYESGHAELNDDVTDDVT